MHHKHEMSREKHSQKKVVPETFRVAEMAAIEKRIVELAPLAVRLVKMILDAPEVAFNLALSRLIQRNEVALRTCPLTSREVVVDRRPGERRMALVPRSKKEKAQLSILFMGAR